MTGEMQDVNKRAHQTRVKPAEVSDPAVSRARIISCDIKWLSLMHLSGCSNQPSVKENEKCV